ncbi:MAG: hypothetical protein U1E55_00225 [Paracoccus sp. (in: a-proteobacteria)]
MLGLPGRRKIGATGKSGWHEDVAAAAEWWNPGRAHLRQDIGPGFGFGGWLWRFNLRRRSISRNPILRLSRPHQDKDQLIFLPAGSYAVFSVPKGGDARKVLADHWDDKVMSRDVPAFEIGGRLYVHLRIKPVS